jgi:hypothetical protein
VSNHLLNSLTCSSADDYGFRLLRIQAQPITVEPVHGEDHECSSSVLAGHFRDQPHVQLRVISVLHAIDAKRTENVVDQRNVQGEQYWN